MQTAFRAIPHMSLDMQQLTEPEAGVMTLREHLLSAQPQQSPGGATHEGMHSAAAHEHHIDPAIAGAAFPVSLDDAGVDDSVAEVRKGRRELSTSKRAAQNRAAQRAFRQRKEAYITSLQEKVKEYETMIGNYKAVQQENYQLREYVGRLQNRLIELQVECPPPPAHVDLSNPPQRPDDAPQQQHQQQAHQQQSNAPTVQMTSNAIDLRLAAAAAEQAAGITTAGGGQQPPSSGEMDLSGSPQVAQSGLR